MKKRLVSTLLLLVCGCTSVQMGRSAFHDLSFARTDKPGEFAVTFMDMASAFPVYDWRLRVTNEGGTNVFRLCIYSNLLDKKPLESIRNDARTCYTTITVSMPNFRLGTDRLLLVDHDGTYPMELRESGRIATESSSNTISVANQEGQNPLLSVQLGNAKQTPFYSGVDAPKSVVAQVKRVLAGSPSTWEVNNITNFTDLGNHIVCMSDSRQEVVVYLIEGNQWYRLNEKTGLSFVGRVLDGYLKTTAILDDCVLLEEFLDDLGFLYKGPGRIPLTTNSLKRMERNIGAWLGEETNPEKLRVLCWGPRVTHRDNGGARVECNFMNQTGGIEGWTVGLKLNHRIVLVDITISNLVKEGSFNFALVGSPYSMNRGGLSQPSK